MIEHEHIFGRVQGSSNPWLCLDCKVEDTRTEIEFVQDEIKLERKRILDAFAKERTYFTGLAGVGNGQLLVECIERIVSGE